MADKAEIVKLYYELGKSVVLVRRKLVKLYPSKPVPSRWNIVRLVEKFEREGIATDLRQCNKRPIARTGEKIEQVRQVIEATPRKSIRGVMKDISNIHGSSSYGTVRRILKFDLKHKPYKITIMQHLKDSDITKRVLFSKWIEDNGNVIDSIWFSDECHFYLNGSVNKQNLRYWSAEKPTFYEEKTIHSEKVTVWAAMSATGIIGPFFYEEDGHTATVNGERYLNILTRKFIPALQRRGIMSTCWFQQDGAGPHTANHVLEKLEEKFRGRLISLKTPNEWPPHSPDLSPLDYFLWGTLKEHVYNPMPTTIDELKNSIRREMRLITQATCNNVIQNFRRRIRLISEKRGGHIEHLL